MRMYIARALLPLTRFNPPKELAIGLTGEHVKPIRSIEMNVSDLDTAALTDSYHHVVFVSPNNAIRR